MPLAVRNHLYTIVWCAVLFAMPSASLAHDCFYGTKEDPGVIRNQGECAASFDGETLVLRAETLDSLPYAASGLAWLFIDSTRNTF